jgi:hypothetical protein
VARRQPIVDVDDLKPAAGEGQSHQPMSVLRQDAKAAAMNVQHRGKRPRAIGGPVDVEEVLHHSRVAVGDVADHLDAMALEARVWMEPPHARQAAEHAVDDQGSGPPPQLADHELIICAKTVFPLLENNEF